VTVVIFEEDAEEMHPQSMGSRLVLCFAKISQIDSWLSSKFSLCLQNCVSTTYWLVFTQLNHNKNRNEPLTL